ncbi:hypothetical protein [Proteiniborus sp. MB09-C3]|uniref:hypothetical protein n=1 Tax=Proteiniborus sp. MB09-C3 TaxID=3050072 RepID=UPI002554DFC2|nr:hypothetical protein [Proteiniborus sp. MB09-C3]WIV11272.1 hypothetical protein QO263_14080 [Proteiniborus sp. MB09-C3]
MDTNKLNKLFLILGIGIGFLISSLLNIAYPKTEYISYTEAQIIEKARELGMISLKEAISKDDEKTPEYTSNDSEKDATPAEEDKHVIEFVINKGDNSEQIVDKLFEEGIIKDKEGFIEKIKEKSLQRKFKYGVYELELEMDHESLIKTLTGK